MELSIKAIKISKPALLIAGVGILFLAYFILVNSQDFPGIFSKLAAVVLSPTQAPPSSSPEEIAQTDGMADNFSQELGVKKHVETAQEGEGITHLARRALKNYLQDNPQSFQVSPEHKVYIEDYLAKKMGGQTLKLGQTVEFSDDLLKEAIQEAEMLSPQQIENLGQFSQLAPSLNY